MKSNCNIKGKKYGGISFAILLVGIGVLFLLLNLNIIPIAYKPIIISWQMLLIVIGIWNLCIKHYVGGIVLIAIGGFFIYPALSSTFPEHFAYVNISNFWPVLLIIGGICLIFKRTVLRNKRHHYSHNDYSECADKQERNSSEYIDKNIMFGSSEQIILSQTFKGGEANVMFGELIIDLRKAKLAEGTHCFEANAMFGSITIYVPADWVVELQSSSMCGEFEDKRNDRKGDTATENTPRLIIAGNCMFAGGEVKN